MEETNISGTGTVHDIQGNAQDGQKEIKKRSGNKDRTKGKISRDDFIKMEHSKKFEYAKKYLVCSADEFDNSGEFQFSQAFFADKCKDEGIIKKVDIRVIDQSVSDDAETENSDNEKDESLIIYIPAGKRTTAFTRYSLSEETRTEIENILGKAKNNQERSRMMDAILLHTFKELNAMQEEGKFHIDYQPEEPKRIL